MLQPWAPREYIVDGDFSHQFLPFRAFAGLEWWHLRIPLWNPGEFAGDPFQADPQTAVFYPIAVLNAIVFGRRNFPFVALELEVVVHTFLAAAFTYLLARELTRSRIGALVAAIAFGFGGFITSYPAQQLPVLETAAWLPLIIFCLERSARRPIDWRWLAGGSLGFAVAILAGHSQTDLLIAYVGEGYLIWRLWLRRTDWQRIVAAAVAFPIAAAALALIQLAPTAEFVANSTRDAMDYATAAHGYLLSSIPEILFPFWHGEKALSVGVAAFGLALYGAWCSRREPLAFWSVVGLVAVPLSTGGETPLFWALYHFAPGWNLFRDQERVICVFSLAAALLAARGVAEIELRSRTGRNLRWLATGFLVAAAAVGVAFLTAPAVGAVPALRTNFALDAIVLGAAGTLVVVWATRARPVAWFGLVFVALVAAEAFAINFGNNLGPTSPDARPRLAATINFVRQLGEPFRVRGISEAIFPSDYAAMMGVESIGGDSPIEPLRIHEMLNSDADWRVWQILNVKYFLSDGGQLAGLNLVYQDGPLKTYFMQDSLPRAWAVRTVEVARSPAEAKQLILAPGYHPGNAVVLEKPPSIGPFTAGQRPDVHITHLDPQRIAIDATSDGNAMLVLADNNYPDWYAYRDGQPVTLFQANYLAMAVELPPGTHHYEFVYRPWTFYLGAVVSLLSALGLLWLCFRGQRAVLPALPSITPPDAIVARLWWVGALAVLAVGFYFRVHDLSVPNLTGDEWFMLRNHDEGPLWIIHQAHVFEPHPLLYYLGLAAWIELAGRTEFALRFPSVVGSLLFVVAMVGLGRALAGRRAALLLGLLAALNPYEIAEAQNARNYAPVAGLSALASLLFLRALSRGRRGDWLAYGAAMLLALNTHLDAALVLAAHVVYGAVWFGVWRKGNARTFVVSFATIGAVFAAWIAYAWPALMAYQGYFPNPVTLDHVLTRTLATFSLGAAAPVGAAVPFFILALLGLGGLAWTNRRAALFSATYVAVPVILVGILFLRRPMFDERYLIVLAPGFLTLVAGGIDQVWRRFWPAGIAVAAVTVWSTAPAIQQTYQVAQHGRPNFRAVADWVASIGQPDDPLIATGLGQAHLFAYYYQGPQTLQVLDDPTKLTATLGGLLPEHPGLVLLPYFQSPADQAAFNTLGRSAIAAADHYFDNARVVVFASPAFTSPRPNLSASWKGGLSLASVDFTGSAVPAGEPIGGVFHFNLESPSPALKASLRLLDDNGDPVAQSDVPLAAGSTVGPGPLEVRMGLVVPSVTPPGAYRVTLYPYQAASGAALTSVGGPVQADGGLPIGTIDVRARPQPVAPDEAGVALIPSIRYAGGVSLLGHDPVASAARAGDWLSLRLLWRADASARPDLSHTLTLRGPGGSVVDVTAPIVPGYPTSHWSAGQLLAERVRVRIPPTAANGRYTVSAQVGDGQSALLGSVEVTGPTRNFAPITPQQAIGAQFGDFAALVGVNGGSAPKPGGDFAITLIWEGRATPDHAYSAFVHLLDQKDRIVSQIDRQPVDGARPTDGWVAGEYLEDGYSLPVPTDLAPGQYSVEVGLYDPASGARVPVTVAGRSSDHVIVGTYEVEP
jgi:hypothetical protein